MIITKIKGNIFSLKSIEKLYNISYAAQRCQCIQHTAYTIQHTVYSIQGITERIHSEWGALDS